MAFIKKGEAAQILQDEQYPVSAHLHNPMAERVLADPDVIARFEKVAAELKAVAPKAKDFLYFSAVMMHAAEASLLDTEGVIKKSATGEDLISSWDTSNNSWKWVCSDPSLMPYRNANCFAPGTGVLMADGTIKNIEDVEIGDEVITHLGNKKKVTKTSVEPLVGDVLKIHTRNELPLIVTKEHPFYQLIVTHPKDRGDTQKHLLRQEFTDKQFKFVEAEKLSKYDLLATPVVKCNAPNEFSNAQARLLGIFAAEGSFNKKYGRDQGVNFTFSIDEEHTLAAQTKVLLESSFENVSVHIYVRPDRNTTSVTATGSGVASFFRRHVGEYSQHKSLSPHIIFNDNDNIRREFLIGWLEGDGCVEKEYGQLIGVTTSRNLAHQTRLMLNSLGIHSSIRFVKTVDEKVINEKYGAYPVSDLYRIEIPSTFANEIVKNSSILNFSNKPLEKRQNVFYNNYHIKSIKSVKEIKYDGFVYNFQVEDDNSYIANNIAVHNCDIFPESELVKAHKQWVGCPLCLDHKSNSVDSIRGVVVDTYYDAPKKRVIALCALDKLNYPDLARKVQTRVSHCVSMGTAVGQAICYDCGNVARVEQDFCDHMRNKTCYGEINIDLKPIELSIVVNGADPNAKIKHIIAAASSLAEYAEQKERQLSKLSTHEMIDPDAISAIKKDLEGIMQKLTDLEGAVEKVKDIEEKEETGEYPQEKEEEGKEEDGNDVMSESSLNKLTVKLAGVFSGLHEKLDKIQGNMKNLQENGEDTMTTKKADLKSEAYFQGGGDVNEPTPGKPKYEKEDSDSIRDKEDKQMVGAPPFPGVGATDGLYGDDLKQKEMVLRAEKEKEERAFRRQSAVDRAKAALESKAYFQGGGDVNEPTPGKPKYEKEDSDSIRDKEDKQMVGAPPFPDVGAVDGLYGDDKKKKEMLLRAHLKGRFVKAANSDGSENKGESRWHIFADDKIILTATVNELTNGKTATLYDSVANKEFGKKILSIVRSNDLSEATEILKGAQLPPPAAPAPAAPVEPAPEMGMGEDPRDAGGTGDPKEELPELLTTAENTLADIRAAVEALLEEGEAGLEGFDELSEGMGAEATKVVGLHKLSKKVGKAMLVGMKSAHHELSEQINELKMAKHVHNNRDKVRKDQVEYVDGLVADAVADTKKVLESCYGLMSTFVKYADGTKDVEKRAEVVKKAQGFEGVPGDPLLGIDGEPIAMSEREQEAEWARQKAPGSGARQAPVPAKPAPKTKTPPAPNLGIEYYPGWEKDPSFPWKQQGRTPPTGISTPEGEGGTAGEPIEGRKVAPTQTSAPGYTGGPQDMGALDEGEIMDDATKAEMLDGLMDADDGATAGEKAKADEKAKAEKAKAEKAEKADEKAEEADKAKLDTKEARAEAREKMAAKAMKWHPLLNEAHPGGGETTQLDIKPEGDLAKVERLDETHAKMVDVATAPPRVRQAAEEIQKLVALGKIDPKKDFDELIAEGLDKDAVSYWKQYWGQASSEGSQFASELVKEYAAKKKAEKDEAYRVKVARAYDLAHDMVRRGMLVDDRTAVNAQVNEFLSLSDKAFESYKRFTEKQAINKQASMPQVGMLTGEPSVVVGPPAAQANLNVELDAAFADLPLKGRLF